MTILEDLTMTDGEYPALDPRLENAIYAPDEGFRFVKYPPLINTLYCGEHDNKRLNNMLYVKQPRYDQAVVDCEWGTALFLTERPWRVDVLVELSPKMCANEFAEHLGTVWTDAEVPYQSTFEFNLLWQKYSRTPRPESLMDEGELAQYLAMPDYVKLYRGCDRREASGEWDIGRAWTSDKRKAQWFADRLHGKKDSTTVMEIYAPREKVLACFNGRNESEYVLTRNFLDSIL